MTKPKLPLRRRQPETEVISFRATAEEIRAAVGVARQLHPDKKLSQNSAFRELALSREDVRRAALKNWVKGE